MAELSRLAAKGLVVSFLFSIIQVDLLPQYPCANRFALERRLVPGRPFALGDLLVVENRMNPVHVDQGQVGIVSDFDFSLVPDVPYVSWSFAHPLDHLFREHLSRFTSLSIRAREFSTAGKPEGHSG